MLKGEDRTGDEKGGGGTAGRKPTRNLARRTPPPIFCVRAKGRGKTSK